MDCETGKLYSSEDALKAFEEMDNLKLKHLAPLSERQFRVLEPLGCATRKNYMRNQPCVCGSDKKFKRCCWDKYA